METSSLDQINEERLVLLQKQVDIIQIKLLDEKKRKWYINPSLWLSIIAFLTSMIFSTREIIKQQKEKSEQNITSKTSLIKQTVENLIEEEKSYLQISSNPNNIADVKTNAGISFQQKISALLDKIVRIDNTIYRKIEPNILINYARYLTMRGQYEESLNALKTASVISDSTKDDYTKSVILRSLANIYANPSYNKSDSLLSRDLRTKDINLWHNSFGDSKWINSSSSFELWALDEYFLLKNINKGNMCIDSALFYINKLPDNNLNKQITLNRLKDTYNFYNKILIQSNIGGEYHIYSNDGYNGEAYITSNLGGLFIKIEFYGKGGKLLSQYKGSGNFSNYDKLKFDVDKEIYNSFLNSLNFGKGVISLTSLKGKKLSGYFYEYNNNPVHYTLFKFK